jgi:amidase/aspartyl-tRNA(Asn)/glutamyl-tRNA(Gln) amidotransferase subunit A
MSSQADKPKEYSIETPLDSCRSIVEATGFCREELIERALVIADSSACQNVFIRRFDAQARMSARCADQLRAAGAPLPALAGLPVSIKDLFDVAGFPTTAASATLADAAVASVDSAAVARLRAAGAALVGHTNMTEFAYSGVGINPHHGTPINPAAARIDPLPRIPGGSTSGGAVSVASGAAIAALGSDTGGSIRIPAALQGLVGFKNTLRLTPLTGSIPLSPTLDTACAITRCVADAALLHAILADRPPVTVAPPLQSLRLAMPLAVMTQGLASPVALAFERAIARLRQLGASIDEIDLSQLSEAAGADTARITAAEAWAWHRQRMVSRGAEYDPRVATRIRRGETVSAADYINLLGWRRDWISRVSAAGTAYDALLSPTVPLVAPTIESMLADDELFFATNAALLRNASLVNLLDGCALSLPCHQADELPVGLMVWGCAMGDDRVLAVSLTIEAALRSLREV